MSSTVAFTVDREHPYLGPEYYREVNKDFFYGRNHDIQQLLKLVQRNPVTVLSGKSGLGKSSLIHAGLIPKLREADYLPVYLRFNFEDPKLELLDNFKSSISDQCRRIDPTLPDFGNQTLWEYFHRIRILNGYVIPVLILDQFEELFTRGDSFPDQVKNFLTEITDLVENQIPLSIQQTYRGQKIPIDINSQNYRILFSLREDYLARMEMLGLYMPSLKKSRYRIVQMTEEQALEAIYQPGKAILSEAASKKILQLIYEAQKENSTVRNWPSQMEIEPFILSLVCFHINNLRLERNELKITGELLQKIKVKNIIERFYEDSVSFLSPKARNILEEKLLTNEGFRKPQPKTDLVQKGILSKDDIDDLIDKRILRREIWSDNEYVELIHDILVPVIKERLNILKENKKKNKILARAAWVLFGALMINLLIWEIYNGKQNKELVSLNNQQDSLIIIKESLNNDLTLKNDSLKLTTDSLKTKTNQLELQKIISDSLRKVAEKERDNANVNAAMAAEAEASANKSRDEIKNAIIQEKKRTIEKLELLKDLTPEEQWRAENIITNVSAYLWLKEDDASLDTLVQLLQHYEEYIPADYGLNTPEGQTDFVQDSLYWPLTLVYNPDRSFSWQGFTNYWQTFSVYLVETWGIPTPWKIKFSEDNKLPLDQMMISVPGLENMSFRLPEKKGYILVTKNGLKDERLIQFFDDNEKNWELIESLKYNGPWYLAPKWTQPIFKVGGHNTSPGEAGIALVFASELLNNPEYLLNTEVTKLLLEQIYDVAPTTVAEALKNGNGIEGIKETLINIVKFGYSLSDLEYYLDFLADVPYDSPSTVSYRLTDPRLTIEMQPIQLQGKRSKSEGDNYDSIFYNGRFNYYKNSLQYLESAAKIRIYLGSETYIRCKSKKEETKPEFFEIMDNVRGDIYHQFGLQLPQITYQPEDILRKDEMRIELLNQNIHDTPAKGFIPEYSKFFEKLREEMLFRCSMNRISWITPGTVQDLLNGFSLDLADWFAKHYTPTDLKNILRAVISPQPDELEFYANDQYNEAISSIPSENTIFNDKWLLKSMVFWLQTGIDPLNLEQLREALIKTQYARLYEVDISGIDPKIEDLVIEGIQQLEEGSIEKAEDYFKEAVRKNQLTAVNSFLIHYRDYAKLKIDDVISIYQIIPGDLNSSISLYNNQLMDLEIYLQNNKKILDQRVLLNVYAILLDNYMKRNFFSKADQIVQDIFELSNKDEWDISEKYLVGYYCLKSNSRHKSAPERMTDINNLLTEAIKLWPADKLDRIYKEIIDLMIQDFYDLDWSARLLMDLADQRPENFWVNYYTGHFLANKVQYQYSQAALNYLDKAEKSIPVEGSGRLKAWLDLSRGNAYYIMSGYPEKEDWLKIKEKDEALLQNLIEKTSNDLYGWPQKKEAVQLLYNLYIVYNELDRAELLISMELIANPSDKDYLECKFFTLLAKGDVGSALLVAKNLTEIDNKYFFNLSMVQILKNDDNSEYTCNRFFETDHEYKDYIRLWLYYYFSTNGQTEKAQLLIEKRWKQIEDTTWAARMENGDYSVIREILIGYYHGNDIEDIVFKPLNDKQNFENYPISKTSPYQGLRCEIYFYKALLHAAKGEQTEFKENLKLAASTNFYSYYEYQIARYMLNQIGGD